MYKEISKYHFIVAKRPQIVYIALLSNNTYKHISVVNVHIEKLRHGTQALLEMSYLTLFLANDSPIANILLYNL